MCFSRSTLILLQNRACKTIKTCVKLEIDTFRPHLSWALGARRSSCAVRRVRRQSLVEKVKNVHLQQTWQ